MVAAEIWGIQSQNISGCVKHYTFNNEETDRSGMSSNVDQRPAKELYFKPFAAAVDAGVGSAMCSYNCSCASNFLGSVAGWCTPSTTCSNQQPEPQPRANVGEVL